MKIVRVLNVIVIVGVIFSAKGWSQRKQSGKKETSDQYTLTIYADRGLSAGPVTTEASSGSHPNLGHVFVELTHNEKQMYLGYYGQPTDPAKGQLRVDADLAKKGYWTVKKTYSITEQGYLDAHKMIDAWDSSGQSWRPWCNCSDFAEAVAKVAGIDLTDLGKVAGLNTPASWADYLFEHEGTVNPRFVPESCSFLVGYADGALGPCMHLCNFGGPDAACQANCRSQYARNLSWETQAIAKCIRENQPSLFKKSSEP